MGLVRDSIAGRVREVQVGANTWVAERNRLPTAAVRIAVLERLLDVFSRERRVQLVPDVLVPLRVHEKRIADRPEVSVDVAVTVSPFPRDLVEEAKRTKDGVHEQLEVVARCGITVKVDRSGRLKN